jgi:hypothetical protein
MEDMANRDFLIDGTDVMLCNNANDVFSDRSELRGTKLWLNHILVGLFIQVRHANRCFHFVEYSLILSVKIILIPAHGR